MTDDLISVTMTPAAAAKARAALLKAGARLGDEVEDVPVGQVPGDWLRWLVSRIDYALEGR